MTTTSVSFMIPSEDEFRRGLTTFKPRRSVSTRSVVIGVLVSVLLVSLLLGSNPLGLLLPWVAVIGVTVWLWSKRARIQLAQERLRKVQEMAMLRHSAAAFRGAWELLPRLVELPNHHGQAVSLMAGTLMRLHEYDLAIMAYDHLLKHLPQDHPAGRFLRLQRLMAILHQDRLADGDSELRGMRSWELEPVSRAIKTQAVLYQQIKTHHFEDAVKDPEAVSEQLRPLGVDASYGQALMAAAYLQLGEAEAARAWWQRATLLHPASELVYEMPETRVCLSLAPAPPLPAVEGEVSRG